MTKEDLKKAKSEISVDISDEKFNELYKILDANQNDLIEYQEFLRVTCDKNSLLTEENLRNTFLAISGREEKEFINKDDIKKFIFRDSNIHKQIFNEYLEQFGMQKDDKINFDQFYDIIKNDKKLNNKNNIEGEKLNNIFIINGPFFSTENEK